MANVKISDLTAVVSITPSTDVLPLVSGGSTKSATPTQVVNSVLNTATSVGIGTASPAVKLDVAGPIKTLGYTIATLPTGVVGMRAYVTNGQTSPTYLGAVSTTGAVTAPVFYNGTAWVYG
jgi:hypothetical protein